MYAIDDEEIVPRHFAVCNFYGVETCFCWNADKLIIYPYTKDSSTQVTQDARILSTPAPIKKVQFFDNRAFLICLPQGAYKVSRNGEFALLSKNALGMGGEFFQVLIVWNNGIYLDNKQVKSSKLLFPLTPNASEIVCTFSLNPASTEPQLMSYFAAGWEAEGNLCVVGHHRKLYTLRTDTVQLIYTSDSTIVDILPVKRRDKVAGLLLLTEQANLVILVHDGGDKCAEHGPVFERIYLKENDSTMLCATFSLQMENVLWMICCNQFRTYYIRKELFVEAVQEVKVEERTFTCMQYYKPNTILGLSQRKELIEVSLEELDNSLSIDNNIVLHTAMFQKTDIIMEKICAKVKEFDALYENLSDEQDTLKRINIYAAKQKLQISPNIKISRLCKHRYLGLHIPDKLPKSSYVVFSFASKNQSTFCMKKVMKGHALTVKMPINKNQVLHSSSINMDLITLVNEQRPWCLVQNFINSPLQQIKRKGRQMEEKTNFIDTKISSLLQSIAGKELTMTKLCEIKKIVRAELCRCNDT
ncbi:hypothetical protein ALC60_10963 [Trachymyrmex zeteki]|uniref:Uncharacterized protein n=1 Tax=Mycetomoellerius zeteki TaxID=64791 RepID=A0A151WPW5_9HYME|nr:PREDICTED: uncharacterized protein LOC108727640 [Trachymyrmex zeteki]XP_018311319.1 PREDICTED: uncharacterized protein LOC108727640 [Trachymyrmex zeteki]KYQ49942.1 hypothetical protein ALC60_10963 [Trachymyrmex zeteki]